MKCSQLFRCRQDDYIINLLILKEVREFMTSKQRAYLRKLANTLDPVIRIGKDSVTPELTEAVAETFHTHELIKIQVLKNCLDEPYDLADLLAERTHSHVVQVIGKRIVLYKPDPEDPKIVLPK